MAESTGEGLAPIFDTTQAGYAAISTGNNNLVSLPIDTRYAKQVTVQILTDGGAKVNWSLQVTNLPPSIVQYGRTIFGAPQRDDSYASNMWSQISSGQQGTGASPQSTYITQGTSVARAMRVTFNWDASNTGGSTANIIAVVRTVGGM